MLQITVPRLQHKGLQETTSGAYTLVRYSKPLADISLAVYRSTVFKGDKLVAFTPPRSVNYIAFQGSLHNSTVREYVDGTMVYLWHDESEWNISTRSRLAADKVFRRDVSPLDKLENNAKKEPTPTPRDVFMSLVRAYEDAHQTSFFGLLDTSCTYVFSVLMEKSFNVVKPICNDWFLVTVYKISEGNQVQEVEVEIPDILQPPVHLFRDQTELLADLNNRDYSTKGYFIYDLSTGETTKLMNPAYLKVFEMYGRETGFNKAVLKYVLENREQEIIQLNGGYKRNVDSIVKNMLRFTNLLYTSYIACFILKEKLHKEYDEPYRHHMYVLHGEFLKGKQRVTKQRVTAYVRNMPFEDVCKVLGV